MKDANDPTPIPTELNKIIGNAFAKSVYNHLADGASLAAAVNQAIETLYLELKGSQQTAHIAEGFRIEFLKRRRKFMEAFACGGR